MEKDNIKGLYTYLTIENLHQGKYEDWDDYYNRLTYFNITEKSSEFPSWANKRGNIIFLKAKRRKERKDRWKIEEEIRKKEDNDTNKEEINTYRKTRWEKEQEIRKKEDKEITDLEKKLYDDLTNLEEENKNLKEKVDELMAYKLIENIDTMNEKEKKAKKNKLQI